MLEEKKKPIIIINGIGGSGKDTFVEFASQYASICNFSSIDKIKEIASLQFFEKDKEMAWLTKYGWKGLKTEKDRKFLSSLKRACTEYNDLPFYETMKAIENFQNSDKEIMFIHIREPEEIRRTKNAIGGVFTLLIKRSGLDNITSNPSDALVDNYPYVLIIENNTLEDLEVQAKQFIENLLEYENGQILKLEETLN